MNKPFYYTIMGMLILIMACIIYITYLMAFDTLNPIVYNGDYFPAKVITSNGRDYIVVNVSYCRNTDVPVIVTRSYVDSLVYHAPPEQLGGTEEGCHTEQRMWEVPYALQDGEYYVITRSEFKVNAIATRSVTWQTTTFNYTRGGNNGR